MSKVHHQTKFLHGRNTPRRRSLAFETLEDRRVLAASLSTDITQGNLAIRDQLGRANHLTFSLIGANLVIADSLEQFMNAPPGGTLSANNQTLTIPIATVTGSTIISTGIGDDVVQVDTTGDAIPISPGGLTIDLGSGNDTLGLANNTTDNVWSVDGPQNGTVKMRQQAVDVILGMFNFAGLEHAVGGTGKDAFKLKNIGPNGIQSIDGGGTENLLDKIEITRGGKFVLTDSQLSFNPSASSVSAGQTTQTFQLSNIKRANLTGSLGNDSFDVSGWTQHGDNTDPNRYGGLILAAGGTDTLIKRADISTATLDDGNLQTSDGMYLRLAGNLRVILQDTSAASPVLVDLSGRTKPASLIANHNATDAIKYNDTTLYPVTLADTYLSYNNGFSNTRIQLTGFNQSTITTQANDQVIWYRNLSWTGTQTLDGTIGINQVIVDADQNLTMQDDLLSLSGGFKVHLTKVESFKFKAFTNELGPHDSHDNTFNLSDWLGNGIIEGGDGNDLLIVNHSQATTPQVLEFKPTAAVINGKVIQFAKANVATWNLAASGGSANDKISLVNWRGEATVDGVSGDDSLSVQRDRDMDLNPHQVIIKKQAGSKEMDKNIIYDHIAHLTAAGGNGYNTFTLNPGYDTGLAADNTGLILKSNSPGDTLKTSVDENISSSSDALISSIIIGNRTLTFLNFQRPDDIIFTPVTPNKYQYTFTNFELGNHSIIDGANRVSFTLNSHAYNYTINRDNILINGSSIDIKNIGDGGLVLTGSSQADVFVVNGWTGPLTINGG